MGQVALGRAGLFAALLFFWLAPGFEHQTFIFGLAHGIGYIALCLLILVAIIRREAPWPLLAATLTPVGPVGSVIGIELIERRGWGVETPSSLAGIDTADRTVDNRPAGRKKLKRLVPGPVPPPGSIASEIPPWLPTRRRGAGRVDPLPPAAPPRHYFT